MNARTSNTDAYLIVASLIIFINILNMTAWSVGLFVTPFLTLLIVVGFLLLYSKSLPSNILILAVFVLFVVMILGSPINGWDARSIYFFHAKRIFFDGSLYAQLDDYAPWSVNDRPNLVPAAAASIAKTVGYWNEIFPRLAVLPILFPIFLIFRWLITKHEIYALWLAGMLIVSRKTLLNGYMDAILALYCGAAILLITLTYSRNTVTETIKSDDPNPFFHPRIDINERLIFVTLFFIIATIPFIKNEGLLASLLLIGILFANFRKYRVLILLSLFSLIFYFLIWKLEVIQHHIGDYLFADGFIERGLARIEDWRALSMVLHEYLMVSFYILPFFLAIIYFRLKNAPSIPVLLFVTIYTIALMMIFLIDPFDLLWQLRHSAYRTFLVTNCCMYSYIFYSLDNIFIEPISSPRSSSS